MTKVDVSLGDVSISKVPQVVAADQGIYAKCGLDVQQTIFVSAARTAAAPGVVVPDGHVIARPGIARLEDLKGNRIGFTGVGSVTHFSALSLAKQLRLDGRP